VSGGKGLQTRKLIKGETKRPFHEDRRYQNATRTGEKKEPESKEKFKIRTGARLKGKWDIEPLRTALSEKESSAKTKEGPKRKSEGNPLNAKHRAQKFFRKERKYEKEIVSKRKMGKKKREKLKGEDGPPSDVVFISIVEDDHRRRCSLENSLGNENSQGSRKPPFCFS